MPAAMTWTLLKQDVRKYLERGASAVADPDVFDQIPRLITLAEHRCAKALKVQGFQRVLSSDLVAGTSVYAKPDRFRQTVSMHIGVGADNTDRKAVLPRSYEYCRAYWPNEATREEPLFYADYNETHWLISPTPDEAYPWEIIVFEQPALLDDTNETNWLTDKAPQLLLYATLLEASPFLKNDARLPVWQGMFNEAVALLDDEDFGRVVDRATVRKEA